jgi:4-hydroxy-tetrahydrodipicolinate synthase
MSTQKRIEANMTKTIYSGILPVVPTTFTETGDLDLDSQRRALDCIVDQGVDGACILANFSEQFLLTDDERDALLTLCLDHIAGRIPIIVTCSHFSTRIAVERAKRAEDAGAAMIMMMPPYHGTALKADEIGIREHFERLADAIDIPIMVQDAPLSGVTLSVRLLVELAQAIPQLAYFKIETPGTAAKIRALIEAAGRAIDGPLDGEESITLMADLDAGATGSMSSALLPELIKPVIEHHQAGDRDKAATQYARILPLINYENRQCGLRAAKTVMMEGGVITSDAVRHPLEPLHPATRKGLLELARSRDVIALRWGR